MNKQRIEKQDHSTALQMILSGYVQGLGVRPAISQLAQRCQLAGSVCNQPDGVHIFIEGDPAAIKRFQNELIDALPKQARIDQLLHEKVSPRGEIKFIIQTGEALKASHTKPISTPVPVDVGICEQCLRESKDPTNRRYQDLFISCCDCGPRYSIIKKMPYERNETAMVSFTMCPACELEYCQSDSRRFHAQTISCPTCGPQAWATDDAGKQVSHHMEAIRFICQKLEEGGIVAIRGLGGYQILVDATNETAVRRLRERKLRQEKPLAVMVAHIEEAATLATVSSMERNLLSSFANPILILKSKPNIAVVPAVSPGLNTLGIMLPTSSLHYWIAKLFGKPLVVTSGNREGEPLAIEVEEAEKRLGNLADSFLHHNRPIFNAVDDSVVQVVAGRVITIRLSRGLAPLSLPIQSEQHSIAMGSHQKNTIAVSNTQQAILSPHIGDLDSLQMRDHYDTTLQNLISLYGIQHAGHIHDLHPDYHSTRLVQQRTENLQGVQHHHAHIVSGMIEHDFLHKQVLGIAFDGTGWGADETVWGGEFLLTTAQDFQRVASVSSFSLCGGEAAIRAPWRIAASLLHKTFGDEKAISLTHQFFSDRPTDEVKGVCKALSRKSLSFPTTSAGRLFDGVAAMILGVESVNYEGQLAMQLESRVLEEEFSEYDFDINTNDRMIEFDWRPVIRQIVTDYEYGVPRSLMASRFHRGFASGIFRVCEYFPVYPVVLAGGCFQNRVLIELIVDKFEQASRKVVFPEKIPINDGGLAAGQLAIGTARTL